MGYGRARRLISFETSTTFSARDEFDQTAGALTGKTAPIGGTWAGAGDADDFQVGSGTASRTAVSDADVNTGRYAISGVAGFAAQIVQVDVKRNATFAVGSELYSGALARYTDTNNWLMAHVDTNSGGGADVRLTVRKRVAGTVGTLQTVVLARSQQLTYWVNSFFTVRLMVDARGSWLVWCGPQGSQLVAPTATGTDSDLATGGVLASGKPGIYDAKLGSEAVTRNYDNFFAFVPAANAACFANQSIEFRSDDTIREDSTGTYWGKPSEYRGAPFYLPPAGDENRVSRIAAMMRRNDVYSTAEANVTDSQAVQVAYTPRFLVIPR